MRGLFLAAFLVTSACGEVCGANDLWGGYGLQLSGTNKIAGTPKASAAIGRIVFGAEGKVSGTSSVNFDGLFLGNPITGKYTFQTDCSLTFELQDTSGGWQHFRGTVRPGGARAEFSQTDAETGGRGVLHKLAESCSVASIRGRYAVTLGTVKAMATADGAGGLSWATTTATNQGTYEVDSDCFTEIRFGVKLRGVVVDGGRTIIAVQADPDRVSTATFTAQ